MKVALVAMLAVLAMARNAGAEASHHQGASPGQVAALGVDRLAAGHGAQSSWDLRTFGSFLTASERLDASADRVPLSAGGSIQNYALNVYAERRFGERWAASVLLAGQALHIDGAQTSDTVWSLSDSYATGRYTVPFEGGALTGLIAVKVPGTYPESEATGAKQVDQETRLLVSLHELGSTHVSLLVGVGYKLRFSGIEDEVLPMLVLPVRIASGFTATASLTGGIAIGGAGSTPKDMLTPGLTLSYAATSRTEVFASYYRTIYGHNVVDAHIATLGVSLGL